MMQGGQVSQRIGRKDYLEHIFIMFNFTFVCFLKDSLCLLILLIDHFFKFVIEFL